MRINQDLIDAQRCLPKLPGVYLFLDSHNQPLYIGKSVNLKNRVASYLRRDADDQEPRIRRMVFEAATIRHIVTDTELLALLLEDALIKKYLPVYNIRQKQFKDYAYLRITEDQFPRLETLNDPMGTNDKIFGPFRDRYFIDRLQQILSRYLGFRSCNEPQPTESCIQLDMGQCLGPCVLTEVASKYQEISQEVVRFLQGNDPGIIEIIVAKIEESVSSLRFEQSIRLRDDLVFCEGFFNRQRFNHRFRTQKLLIKIQNDQSTGYTFENGALREILLRGGRISQVGEQLDLFDLSIVKDDDPRFLLDRANLVYNWLKKTAVKYEFTA